VKVSLYIQKTNYSMESALYGIYSLVVCIINSLARTSFVLWYKQLVNKIPYVALSNLYVFHLSSRYVDATLILCLYKNVQSLYFHEGEQFCYRCRTFTANGLKLSILSDTEVSDPDPTARDSDTTGSWSLSDGPLQIWGEGGGAGQ